MRQNEVVQPSTDEIRKLYNESAPSYDFNLSLLEACTGLKRMRQRLMQRAHGNVLAIAIGTGKDIPLYPENCRVTGIDLSEGMLAIAKKKAAALKRDVTLLQMDAQVLTFADASFDTVICTLALCTIPSPIAALKEMKRVCKPDGKILLLEHGRSSVPFIARMQDFFADGWIRKVGCHLNRRPQDLVTEAELKIHDHKSSLFGVLHAMEVVR